MTSPGLSSVIVIAGAWSLALPLPLLVGGGCDGADGRNVGAPCAVHAKPSMGLLDLAMKDAVAPLSGGTVSLQEGFPIPFKPSMWHV